MNTQEKPCAICGADDCKSALHRSMARGKEVLDPQWERVVKLKKQGKGRRLVRRLLGVKGKPMPDDVKEMFQQKQEQKEDGR